MASLSVSAFDAMLKEIYPDVRVESLAIKNRPLLEWLPKKDEFYGDTYVMPVLYEDPQGRSASLSTAITNAATSKQVKFVATARAKNYGVVEIDSEAIMAASKDIGSFIRSKDTQISGMLRNLGKSIHVQLYRSGSGSLGQIATGGISTTTVTLTNKSDVHNFGVGQTVVANVTDDAVTLKTATTVVGRNVAAGTVTFADDVTGLGTPWAAADYLFTEGDPDAAAKGLAAWLPLSAPGATSFFGVDRTADITRLGGQRLDQSGRSILENMTELAVYIGEEGGEPNACFLNPRAGIQLAEQVGAKVDRMEGGPLKMGFNGFTLVNFTTGPIDIIFDVACPQNRGYMLQRDTWTVAHMGGLPHVVRDDGQDATRGTTADNIQVRGRAFYELMCSAPGYNGVFSVASS